jgi:hypothetical protein
MEIDGVGKANGAKRYRCLTKRLQRTALRAATETER